MLEGGGGGGDKNLVIDFIKRIYIGGNENKYYILWFICMKFGKKRKNK